MTGGLWRSTHTCLIDDAGISGPRLTLMVVADDGMLTVEYSSVEFYTAMSSDGHSGNTNGVTTTSSSSLRCQTLAVVFGEIVNA